MTVASNIAGAKRSNIWMDFMIDNHDQVDAGRNLIYTGIFAQTPANDLQDERDVTAQKNAANFPSTEAIVASFPVQNFNQS
jgi:hypothetical protein